MQELSCIYAVQLMWPIAYPHHMTSQVYTVHIGKLTIITISLCHLDHSYDVQHIENTSVVRVLL